MKIIDIIILSFAKTPAHYQLTVNCLESLKKSKHYSRFNVIVVETNEDINFKDFGVTTFSFNKPFNYNHFANEAIKLSENELIGVFNNDVIFSENWFDEILKNDIPDIYSCSPISLTSTSQREFISCKNPVLGYQIAKHVSGWALVFTRELWLKIGGLDESYSFWCSDDAYAKQLQQNDIEHYLIPTSIVNHVEQGSNTLKTLNEDLKNELTYVQAKVWNKNNNDNKFGLNGK